MTRQQLLQRINDDVTALLERDARQLLHVSEVNAGLTQRASEVRALPPSPLHGACARHAPDVAPSRALPRMAREK